MSLVAAQRKLRRGAGSSRETGPTDGRLRPTAAPVPALFSEKEESVTEIGAPEEEPIVEIIPREEPIPAYEPAPLPVEEPDEVGVTGRR